MLLRHGGPASHRSADASRANPWRLPCPRTPRHRPARICATLDGQAGTLPAPVPAARARGSGAGPEPERYSG